MIPFISIDASMANTAIVYGTLDSNGKVVPHGYELIQTKKSNNKQIRASSDTINRARELYYGLRYAIDHYDPKVIFAETPSGSQSAAGMKSYGMICMLIATCNPPAIEVSPVEAKKLTTGSKTTSKEGMIAWVEKEYPDFPFPRNNKRIIIKSKAEHIADAIAVARAGVQLSQFKQLSAFL